MQKAEIHKKFIDFVDAAAHTQEKQLSPRAQMTVGVHKTCHWPRQQRHKFPTTVEVVTAIQRWLRRRLRRRLRQTAIATVLKIQKINDYDPQTSGTFLSAHWGGWASGVYHAAAATAAFVFGCDWTATGGGIASDCSWHSKQTSSGHRNSRVHCLSIGFRSWDYGKNWQKVVAATYAELTDWLSWQWILMIFYAHITCVLYSEKQANQM